MQPPAEDSSESPGHPIAIVGMACRYPGAPTLESYWDLLLNGCNAITEVPADRWSNDEFYDSDLLRPARMSTRWGGFIDSVDRFDAAFFGISPREALQMEPQQRLLLEVTWEALERAAIAPRTLSGRPVGVFVGISSFDYYERILEDRNHITGYTLTGNAYSVTANRISYLLDLTGPSLAVDTACSSSLVAVHLACQSLRSGESLLALVGGVHVMLSPWVTVACSKGEMMAPDGQCKTFDASANGYVRGEGVGVVVLKLLDRAIADGDPIRAVIHGTAVNQDGRSNGLTAPNPVRQKAVIRAACADAGIAPGELGYVEAHGTGTRVGDPLEIEALGAALSDARPPGTRCIVGAGKTNIGHLEAAAGIAGLIKAALVVESGLIPRNLNFKTLNPLIDSARWPIELPITARDWVTQAPRLAGVNSFGFGGTNAHVILGQPPESGLDNESEAPAEPHLLCLSARTENSLRKLAGRYAAAFDPSAGVQPRRIGDICFSAFVGRDHFPHRATVVASNAQGFSEALSAVRESVRHPAAAVAKVRTRHAPRIAFLFTGQGSLYHAAGRGLFEAHPVFRKTLQSCTEILRHLLSRPLTEVLYAPRPDADLQRASYAQPALFSIEAGLAEVFRSCGIRPSWVIGHSLGEYSAAYAADALSLQSALELVAARGMSIEQLSPPGCMAVVFAGEETVREYLADSPEVALAAINGPQNTVISGAEDAVEALLTRLRAAGIGVSRLSVSQAYHSGLMQPVIPSLRAQLQRTQFAEPTVPLISNLTAAAGAPITSADYWCRHLLEPVRFAAGLQALAECNPDCYIEIGPKPVLCQIGRTLLGEGRPFVPTLNADGNDLQSLLQAAGALYRQGAALRWDGFDVSGRRRRCEAPTYAFEEQRFWISDHVQKGRSAIGQALHRFVHPLLADARVLRSDDARTELSIVLDRTHLPFLMQHCLAGEPVVPATAWLEIAGAAVHVTFGARVSEIVDSRFSSPCFLAVGMCELVLSLARGNDGRVDFEVSSTRADVARVVHACGTILMN